VCVWGGGAAACSGKSRLVSGGHGCIKHTVTKGVGRGGAGERESGQPVAAAQATERLMQHLLLPLWVCNGPCCPVPIPPSLPPPLARGDRVARLHAAWSAHPLPRVVSDRCRATSSVTSDEVALRVVLLVVLVVGASLLPCITSEPPGRTPHVTGDGVAWWVVISP
jgi:hypothetical protein